MFEVMVQKSNLLKIIFTGKIGAEEAKQCAERIESLMGELQPGFRMLTDLRSLTAMDLDCVPHIERVMDLCNLAGIKMVVRVIPDPRKDIGFNILSLFHYNRGVRIVTCKTLEEAEKILA